MRASIGTGIVLIAVGAVLVFAVRAPAQVEEYVDVLDLGLILVWSGILVLVMQVVMHRPPARRSIRPPARRDASYEDPWDTSDVHRPGYAGQTQRLPTIRASSSTDPRRQRD
jgi:hypothetical protein